MSTAGITADRVRQEVRRRIAELTERNPEEVTDTALFIEELGVDSLMAIELMVALDKEYKIDIPEDKFRSIKNVNDAVGVVMEYVNDGHPQ
ncbi:MAG TPA: acyl carrier protein [Acidobacteriota bacterium]|jgi:acyl carrier protein|nr:acyl carrier protein [Acidobacteriota bacterium]